MLEGFINKMRLGGLFPNKRKHKVHGDNDEHCSFCGEVDTMVHRVYSCPGIEHLRTGELWDGIRNVPHSKLFGALYPKLASVDDLKKLFRDIQHEQIQVCTDDSEVVFFTDGSVVDNDTNELRVCSWAVTQAVGDGPTNVVKNKSILPGDQQTVFRAELYAEHCCLFRF